MWKVVPAWLLLLLLLEVVVNGVQGGADDHDPYPNHLNPDPSYTMWWTFDDNDITVKINTKTKGAIVWGLSVGSDRLQGADGVIGWVDDINGTPYLYDVHFDENSHPVIDESQDYKLLHMSQTGECSRGYAQMH